MRRQFLSGAATIVEYSPQRCPSFGSGARKRPVQTMIPIWGYVTLRSVVAQGWCHSYACENTRATERVRDANAPRTGQIRARRLAVSWCVGASRRSKTSTSNTETGANGSATAACTRPGAFPFTSGSPRAPSRQGAAAHSLRLRLRAREPRAARRLPALTRRVLPGLLSGAFGSHGPTP